MKRERDTETERERETERWREHMQKLTSIAPTKPLALLCQGVPVTKRPLFVFLFSKNFYEWGFCCCFVSC